MKKIISLIIALILILTTAAYAERSAVVKTNVNGGSLVLRAGEGTDYARNGYVKDGDAISVISTGKVWSYVRSVDTGREGYIKNGYIIFTDDEIIMEKGKNVYIGENGGSLHVRAGEGTQYASKGYVKHGDAITLLAIGEEWAKIRVNRTGVTGYIKNIYLYGYATAGWGETVRRLLGENDPDSAYEIGTVVTKYANSTVNIRSDATSSAKAVGSVRRGAIVRIYGTKANWYKVTCGNISGYISKNYVSAGVSAKTTANLNVRKSAGSGSALITTLKKGTDVTILSVDGNWCRIKYGKSSFGYVSTRYLKY